MRTVLLTIAYFLVMSQLCGCAHYLQPSDYGAKRDDPRSADVLICFNQAEQFQQISGSLRDWPHNNTFDACMNKLGYKRVTRD